MERCIAEIICDLEIWFELCYDFQHRSVASLNYQVQRSVPWVILNFHPQQVLLWLQQHFYKLGMIADDRVVDSSHSPLIREAHLRHRVQSHQRVQQGSDLRCIALLARFDHALIRLWFLVPEWLPRLRVKLACPSLRDCLKGCCRCHVLVEVSGGVGRLYVQLEVVNRYVLARMHLKQHLQLIRVKVRGAFLLNLRISFNLLLN